MDGYDEYADADVWIPAESPESTPDLPGNASPRISALGWVAFGMSLLSTGLTLFAIAPFARGILAALPLGGTEAISGFAIVWFWPFIPVGIALNVLAGFRGGKSRHIALFGGTLMALAGLCAAIVVMIVDSELGRAAGA